MNINNSSLWRISYKPDKDEFFLHYRHYTSFEEVKAEAGKPP